MRDDERGLDDLHDAAEYVYRNDPVRLRLLRKLYCLHLQLLIVTLRGRG